MFRFYYYYYYYYYCCYLVQEATHEYERECVSIAAENKEMEEEIKRTRRSLIHSQTHLSSNLLLLRHLKEEITKVEEERKKCLQQLVRLKDL